MGRQTFTSDYVLNVKSKIDDPSFKAMQDKYEKFRKDTSEKGVITLHIEEEGLEGLNKAIKQKAKGNVLTEKAMRDAILEQYPESEAKKNKEYVLEVSKELKKLKKDQTYDDVLIDQLDEVIESLKDKDGNINKDIGKNGLPKEVIDKITKIILKARIASRTGNAGKDVVSLVANNTIDELLKEIPNYKDIAQTYKKTNKKEFSAYLNNLFNASNIKSIPDYGEKTLEGILAEYDKQIKLRRDFAKSEETKNSEKEYQEAVKNNNNQRTNDEKEIGELQHKNNEAVKERLRNEASSNKEIADLTESVNEEKKEQLKEEQKANKEIADLNKENVKKAKDYASNKNNQSKDSGVIETNTINTKVLNVGKLNITDGGNDGLKKSSITEDKSTTALENNSNQRTNIIRIKDEDVEELGVISKSLFDKTKDKDISQTIYNANKKSETLIIEKFKDVFGEYNKQLNLKHNSDNDIYNSKELVDNLRKLFYIVNNAEALRWQIDKENKNKDEKDKFNFSKEDISAITNELLMKLKYAETYGKGTLAGYHDHLIELSNNPSAIKQGFDYTKYDVLSADYIEKLVSDIDNLALLNMHISRYYSQIRQSGYEIKNAYDIIADHENKLKFIKDFEDNLDNYIDQVGKFTNEGYEKLLLVKDWTVGEKLKSINGKKINNITKEDMPDIFNMAIDKQEGSIPYWNVKAYTNKYSKSLAELAVRDVILNKIPLNLDSDHMDDVIKKYADLFTKDTITDDMLKESTNLQESIEKLYSNIQGMIDDANDIIYKKRLKLNKKAERDRSESEMTDEQLRIEAGVVSELDHTPESKKTSKANNALKQLREEDWDRQVKILDDILDNSTNYLKNIKKIMSAIGHSDVGEYGYSIGGHNAEVGTSVGDYFNMRSSIDFHSHPNFGFNNLTPSVNDIKYYTDIMKKQFKEYGEIFLKEAYISNGNRLLKMDFGNIDQNKINDLENEILETMASISSKYEEYEGQLVERYKNGKIKIISNHPDEELAGKINDETNIAIDNLLKKYAGGVSTATLNSNGQLIDDVTKKAWEDKSTDNIANNVESINQNLQKLLDVASKDGNENILHTSAEAKKIITDINGNNPREYDDGKYFKTPTSHNKTINLKEKFVENFANGEYSQSEASKKAIENVNRAKLKYEEATANLEKMTKGTDEYKEAKRLQRNAKSRYDYALNKKTQLDNNNTLVLNENQIKESEKQFQDNIEFFAKLKEQYEVRFAELKRLYDAAGKDWTKNLEMLQMNEKINWLKTATKKNSNFKFKYQYNSEEDLINFFDVKRNKESYNRELDHSANAILRGNFNNKIIDVLNSFDNIVNKIDDIKNKIQETYNVNFEKLSEEKQDEVLANREDLQNQLNRRYDQLANLGKEYGLDFSGLNDIKDDIDKTSQSLEEFRYQIMHLNLRDNFKEFFDFISNEMSKLRHVMSNENYMREINSDRATIIPDGMEMLDILSKYYQGYNFNNIGKNSFAGWLFSALSKDSSNNKSTYDNINMTGVQVRTNSFRLVSADKIEDIEGYYNQRLGTYSGSGTEESPWVSGQNPSVERFLQVGKDMHTRKDTYFLADVLGLKPAVGLRKSHDKVQNLQEKLAALGYDVHTPFSEDQIKELQQLAKVRQLYKIFGENGKLDFVNSDQLLQLQNLGKKIGEDFSDVTKESIKEGVVDFDQILNRVKNSTKNFYADEQFGAGTYFVTSRISRHDLQNTGKLDRGHWAESIDENGNKIRKYEYEFESAIDQSKFRLSLLNDIIKNNSDYLSNKKNRTNLISADGIKQIESAFGIDLSKINVNENTKITRNIYELIKQLVQQSDLTIPYDRKAYEEFNKTRSNRNIKRPDNYEDLVATIAKRFMNKRTKEHERNIDEDFQYYLDNNKWNDDVLMSILRRRSDIFMDVPEERKSFTISPNGIKEIEDTFKISLSKLGIDKHTKIVGDTYKALLDAVRQINGNRYMVDGKVLPITEDKSTVRAYSDEEIKDRRNKKAQEILEEEEEARKKAQENVEKLNERIKIQREIIEALYVQKEKEKERANKIHKDNINNTKSHIGIVEKRKSNLAEDLDTAIMENDPYAYTKEVQNMSMAEQYELLQKRITKEGSKYDKILSEEYELEAKLVNKKSNLSNEEKESIKKRLNDLEEEEQLIKDRINALAAIRDKIDHEIRNISIEEAMAQKLEELQNEEGIVNLKNRKKELVSQKNDLLHDDIIKNTDLKSFGFKNRKEVVALYDRMQTLKTLKDEATDQVYYDTKKIKEIKNQGELKENDTLTIKEYEGRIDRTTQHISELDQEIVDIENRLNTLPRSFVSFATGIAEIEKDIVSIDDEIKNAEKTLTVFNAFMKSLDTYVGILDSGKHIADPNNKNDKLYDAKVEFENILSGLIKRYDSKINYDFQKSDAYSKYEAESTVLENLYSELRKNVVASNKTPRTFEEVLDSIKKSAPKTEIKTTETKVNSGNTTIDGDGDGIVIHSPHVTITDTKTTDVIKTGTVNVDANKISGLRFPDDESTPKKKEEGSRKPIDFWVANDLVQELDKLLINFKGDAEGKNKTTYDAIVQLRSDIMHFRDHTDRTDFDTWNNLKGQTDALKDINKRIEQQNNIYDDLVNIQRDIQTKKIGNDQGINDDIIKELNADFDNKFKIYSDSKHYDDAKREETKNQIFNDALKQISLNLKSQIFNKKDSISGTIKSTQEEGKVYSDEFMNKKVSPLMMRANNYIDFFGQVARGEVTNEEIILKAFSGIKEFFDEFNALANSAKSTESLNIPIDTNSINSYIRNMSREGNKKVVGYDDSLRKEVNTQIARLNEFNKKPDNKRNQKEYNEIKKECEALKTKIQLLEDVRKAYSETAELRREISHLSVTGEDDDRLKEARYELEEWIDAIRESAIANGNDPKIVETILGTHDEYDEYANKLIKQIQNKSKSIAESMKRKTAQGYGYTDEFSENVDKDISAAEELIKQLRNIRKSGADAEKILAKAATAFNNLERDYVNVQGDEKVKVKTTQATDLYNNIVELRNNARGMGVSKEDRNEIDKLYIKLRAISEATKDDEGNIAEFANMTRKEALDMADSIKLIETRLKNLGVYGTTAFTKLSKSIAAQSRAMLARYFSLYDIIRYARTAVNTIKELDTAMVELRKVTDGTAKEYADFQKTIRATAVDIASTNQDLISSAADWARLGYSIKEATELAKDARIFVNVGDGVDISGATDMMITAMKAFNIQAEDAMSIVDKFNEIGNHFALSATDIGDAMQRSASVLAASNTSFDESIALITASNEILQDPEKTGTALRTIALRIRGAKSELEEMGEETDYVVKSTSKLRDLIKGYTSIGGKYEGFDIMEDENTFKSLADIIKGIGEVYDEMSDIDRTAMLEKLAGKNRSNALAAMLTNYKQIDNVLKSIEESEGSALEENAHIVDSVQGRITILQTSAENFWQTFLDTDDLKNVIIGLTNILNIVTKIVDKVGMIPMLTAAGGTAFVNMQGGFKRYSDNKYFQKALQVEASAVNRQYEEAYSAFQNIYTPLRGTGSLSELREGNLELADAYDKVNIAAKKSIEVDKQLETQNKITAESFKRDLLGSIWGIGISLAISAAIGLITSYIKSIKEAQKAARDFARDTQNTNKSLDDYAKKIAEANEIIHNEKSSTDEIREAKNNLVDIQNELNETYNNYSTAIKNVNDNLREENELLIANRQEKIRDTLYEAKNAKSPFTNSEYENAIRAFEDKELNWVAENHSLDILTKYGGNRIIANPEGAEDAFRFVSTGNKDEDIKILSQIRDSITDQDEYSLSAVNTLTSLIDSLKESRDTYKDIYLAYGENLAGDKFDDQYQSLMEAYYNNVELNTEESEQLLKDKVVELWNMATDETDAGIRYWLNSMFAAYIDEIKEIDLNDEIIEAATNLAGTRNNNRRGDNYKELSYEDVLAGLNGNFKGTTDSTQKQYIDDLRTALINAGISPDDYGKALDKIGKFNHEDVITFETDLQAAKEEAMSHGMSAEDFDKLGIGTDEELTKWNKIADATTDATERVKMYALATSGLNKALDASTMLKNMESQYKPVFDSMAEAYKAIWSTEGFDISKVTSDQIESVRSQIEGLNESLKEAGEDGFDTDAVNDFILTLSNANATEKEVQDAFNNIATILVDSLNPALSQASGETAALMQKTLTELGVTNAEKVVMSRLGFTMETYAAAKEAAAETDLDIDAEIGDLSTEELQIIANNKALSEYYAARILANSLTIKTSDDVKNLLNLCDYLDISIDKINGLSEAKKKLSYVETLEGELEKAKKSGNSNYISSVQKQLDSANAELESYLARTEVAYEANVEVNPEFDGNTNKSSSSSDSSKDSKQKFDWIERAIKKIQRAVTNLGKVADATYKTWGERLDAIMGKTEEFHDEIGQFGRGNIDLYNRPQYINEDGSVSTVRSMSFGDESGNEILVPTIAFDSNGNPYSMSDDEAIARYYETGEYLGLFKSIEEAEEYAEKLHEQQEAIYAGGGDKFYAGKYQKLKEEIALQEQAAAAYMAEANAIGLAAEYKSKVMNGLMDIETVTDETLKEQISDFQEYYDKATDAADAVEDLRGEIAALAQTKFDNITKQFEEMALAIDHAANRIGSIQNKMASEGYFESAALIKQLKAGNEEKLGQLKQEAQALAASIDEAVSNGDIAYGSEQWWGMYDALQNVNDQIVEMGASIADLNDQLRQLEWDKFDYIAEAVNRLTEENNFLIDVLQGEEIMFEKVGKIGEDYYANGNMSNAALAVQGLHVNNLKILEKQNQTYADEIKKINKELANDPSNKKLLERRNDLIDQQQDIIKGIDDEKHAIKDLIQEGYETFLDYLQKSIDKRKEALEAQKSLYDYENTVAEQTKAIASYQKQISALGGDDSEETQARLQELANNLNAAEKELQQTEYEQWLSDQEKMMDNMYNSFEKLINDRLDDLDGLITQAIQQTIDNTTGISQTIQTEADEFLYNLDNTTFGMNIDARMSDVIGTVNNVENAINNMINAANVNASNELAQLQALAATVATQAAVSAAQRQAQINTTPSNSPSSNSTDTTTTQKTVDNSAEIKKHQSLLESYRQVYIMYKQRAEVIGSKQSHNTAEYQQNRALYLQYKSKADEAQKKMEEEQKQIDKLKKAAYAKGGTIGTAIKKTGEDGIILARSGEEVLSLERVKQMQGVFKMMQPLTKLNVNGAVGGSTTVNGMNISFELPNVTNYSDFVKQAKSDPQFEKLVQSMTIGTSLGKSKLSKYSI